MQAEVFSPEKAIRLEWLATECKQITLPDVTVQNLEKWHRMSHDEEIPDSGLTVIETMTNHCFRDLAPQMKNLFARATFREWKKMSHTEGDLYVHIRKVIPYGRKFGVTHVVSDDVRRLDAFLDDPASLEHSGIVHISRALKDEPEEEEFSA